MLPRVLRPHSLPSSCQQLQRGKQKEHTAAANRTLFGACAQQHCLPSTALVMCVLLPPAGLTQAWVGYYGVTASTRLQDCQRGEKQQPVFRGKAC